MFDIFSQSVAEVYSVTLSQLADYPMKIQVYSRIGSHYQVYDDASKWELIKQFNNFTFAINTEDPRRISFPPQRIGAGQTRAFYIAIVETYGGIDPMQSGLMAQSNYNIGVWASDQTLKILEGIKFVGISTDRPFGNGTESSGVYFHQGPGGLSYNMKDATIRYRSITTQMPSVSPSITLLPSQTQAPSMLPTATAQPSLSPSVSSVPSKYPTDQPSISSPPSEHPSRLPTDLPSTSIVPSQGPSESAMPSGDPSGQPSSIPSGSPSESPSISIQPSNAPSDVPSESPSTSFQPSRLPSISSAPTLDRFQFTSTTTQVMQSSYGIMFEVVPNRAMSVETFHVRRIGSNTQTFEFHIYTRPGSWTSAQSDAAKWTKMGTSIISTNSNPVQISSQALTPVTVYAGQKQSFYIACKSNFFIVGVNNSPDTDEHVTVNPGRRFFPRDDLFSTAGSAATGFQFQGTIIYSHRTDGPSTVPSYLPTTLPSAMPSRSPSSQPSGNPSSEPSTAPSSVPSALPSGMPSLSPSSQPSGKPSNNPSISFAPSPSTDPPSGAPSTSQAPSTSKIPSSVPSASPSESPSHPPSHRPTQSPTSAPTGSPTHSPTQSPTQRPTEPPTNSPTANTSPRIQITIPSKLSITGFEAPETVAEIATVVTIVGPSLAELVKATLKPTQKLKSVLITSINGILVTGNNRLSFTRRHLTARGLGEDLDIEYEIALEELCSTQTCDNAQEISNALYASVTEEMRTEINSGKFATVLKETAAEQDVIVEVAVGESNFEELVVVVLALASPATWYPVWTNGNYCSNDGEQPIYMKHNSAAWLYNTREGCCSRYYSYAFSLCMGVENTGAIGYYPAWDGSEMCVNDSSVPDYMRNKPSSWVYQDIESCCVRYYSYVYADCVTKSGGSSSAIATLKWYVNHVDEICQQDCTTGGSCGGALPVWKTSFETAASCCKDTLSWIATSVCENRSNLQPVIGTSRWYVDHALHHCVQDCTSPGVSATCGGIVTSANVDLYDTSNNCCSTELGWVGVDNCVASSTNTAISSTGSNGWYLNYKLHRCVQDCVGGAPCGGLREKWDELFSSSSACCSTKLWWLDSSAVSCVLT